MVASPYAKKLAAEAGVSLAGVGGSGPSGRIVAADVQQLIASGGAAPAAGAAGAVGAPAPEGGYTDAQVGTLAHRLGSSLRCAAASTGQQRSWWCPDGGIAHQCESVAQRLEIHHLSAPK